MQAGSLKMYQINLLFLIFGVHSPHPQETFQYLNGTLNDTQITDFFKKFGVPVMTVKSLFNFVTDKSITEENIDEYLEAAQQIATQGTLPGPLRGGFRSFNRL